MDKKRLTRRDFLRMSALTAAGMALAGCKATPKETPEPTPMPTVDKSQLTGEFVFASHNEWEARLELTKVFFERNYPKMTYKHDITPFADIWVKLQAQIAAGTPPDITLMHETRAKGFAAKGLLLQLDDFQAKNPMPGKPEEYIGLEQLKYKGKIFVWPSLFAAYAMIYNKDLFDEAGVQYPTDEWTYDDMFDMAKKLSSPPDRWGHLLWTDPSWQGDWYPILKANGGETFNEEDTECLLNSAEAIETFDYMRESWCSEAVPQPSIAQQAGGGLPMFYGGIGALAYINPASIERFHQTREAVFNYGMIFLPAGPKGRFTRIGGSQYAIPAGSKHPDIAWELMRWMIGTEEALQIEYDEHNECLTSRVELHEKFNAPKDPEVIAMVPNWHEAGIEQPLKYGIFIRHSKIGPEFTPMIKAEMDSLADCSKTAAEVARIITDKANQMLAEFKD